jgi:phage baseplate assembly protein W
MRKSFLGRGWAFPVGVNPQGGVRLSAYEENIEQSILLILGTAPGERVMRPDFGCRVHEYVFHPNNATTASLVAYYTREALLKWEPRIDEVVVEAYPDPGAENVMLIDIRYKVIRTNDLKNLVYPFYLRREQDL